VTDSRPSTTDDPKPPAPPGVPAPDAPDDGPPSRVVPAMLGVLAILPTLMLGLLMPAMFRLVDLGSMGLLELLATLLAWLLLPAGIALLFLRRRGAFTVFVLAALVGLATLGSPFARIVLAGTIVSVIGAVIAWLRGRAPRA
jgi:hypothetical protein